ncbi:MAG: hypothetical protein HY921_09100 [Elusimicrobia bacterium]|nr:hypothetical protein [Elusimicrobiota bacterium]
MRHAAVFLCLAGFLGPAFADTPKRPSKEMLRAIEDRLPALEQSAIKQLGELFGLSYKFAVGNGNKVEIVVMSGRILNTNPEWYYYYKLIPASVEILVNGSARTTSAYFGSRGNLILNFMEQDSGLPQAILLAKDHGSAIVFEGKKTQFLETIPGKGFAPVK